MASIEIVGIVSLSVITILILVATWKQNRFYHCVSCKRRTLHSILDADKKISEYNSRCIHYKKHDDYERSYPNESKEIQKGWPLL